jgi:hypothetical protein
LIDRYSTPSSSSDSSMFIGSTDVAHGLAYTLEFQSLPRLCKNSIVDVPDLYIFWIIVCANCISSLYILPSSPYEDDGECSADLITNGWMFHIPTLLALFNSSFVYLFFNNSTSSSYLRMCSFFCTSFSFVTFCNFSIALFVLCFYEF